VIILRATRAPQSANHKTSGSRASMSQTWEGAERLELVLPKAIHNSDTRTIHVITYDSNLSYLFHSWMRSMLRGKHNDADKCH
jgi:hypothetical protein